MGLTYAEAKNRLMQINKKEKEARILSTKIESIERYLQNATVNYDPAPKTASRKERSEIIAELVDMKDKFVELLHDIEISRLELIHEIENLDNEEHAYYLKMRYIYGLDYKQIAYQEHYSYDRAKRKVIEATRYYAERKS